LVPDSVQEVPDDAAVTVVAGTACGSQGLQDARALLVGADGGHEPTREHDRGQERLGGQHPADLLRHDADLDPPGAHPAVLLGEGQAEHAHLGQPRPQLLVEAGVLGDRPAPLLEVGVALGQQAAHRLTQCLLLVVEGEVHRQPPLRVPGSSC
jgi:hypothetical protein